MSENNPMIEVVRLQELAELLREAGYRTNETEQNGVKQLLSASQGIGFALRPGNAASEPDALLDFTLSCALRIQGELPDTTVGAWNQTKRFSRLSRHGDFLVLEMDVIVAGGVGQAHLRASIELWDRLLQEFLLYLRNQHGAGSGSSETDQAAAREQQTDQA
ncbi:hypothetical protein CEK62_20425 (plasmid) [Alcanivorax sp. N3-2A]|nr:hypothetical protein CEK62_00235 [Alcanivorax sp. N3-2A]ASK36735.1 hypothetical protein CEK62_20425 [Alcanivorax sp. N3-2A]